jgi:arginine-tRNA-protein transferase
MTPADLDLHLAKGYFRMSNAMLKTRYFCFDNRLSSLIHIRINLILYRKTRSHRRILNKAGRQFEIRIGKPEINDAIRELYHFGKTRFKASIFHHLDDFLGYDDPSRPFDTQSVQVYDGDRLAAFSLFDRGQTSLYSVIAVYHPDYSPYGLGNATLLEEIRWGQENGYRYHYPGYIFDNNPVFHYKLMAGAIEYLNENNEWRPAPPVIPEFAQTAILERKYEIIGEKLDENRIPWCSRHNPYFISNDLNIDSWIYIRGFIVYILNDSKADTIAAIDFDPQTEIYYLDLLPGHQLLYPGRNLSDRFLYLAQNPVPVTRSG